MEPNSQNSPHESEQEKNYRDVSPKPVPDSSTENHQHDENAGTSTIAERGKSHAHGGNETFSTLQEETRTDPTTSQGETDIHSTVTSNQSGNDVTATSSNTGHDDTVTSGREEAVPPSRLPAAALPQEANVPCKDFLSPSEEEPHRTKEQDTSTSIGLQPLGLPKTRYSTRTDEPVLTLYRRHSEDPFFMHKALNNVPATNPQRTTPVDSSAESTLQRCVSGNVPASNESNPPVNIPTGVSDRPRGVALRDLSGGQRSRTGGGQGHEGGRSKGDTTHVSLNGIHVGVKKKPPMKNKMVKMQSPRVQCCMCAASVMSALLGMFMLSAGVCLLLNYNFLEVDTSGLPPDLHNERGKKVVGIILICVGVAALGLSGLVSTLFYAACSRASPTPKAAENKGQGQGQGQGRPPGQERSGRGHNGQGRYHSNGTTSSAATPVRASPAIGTSAGGRRAGGAGSALPNGRRGNDVRGPSSVTLVKEGSASYSRNSVAGARNAAATPPGAARPYRHGKKTRHGPGRFRNSLPSHPEEVGGGEGHHQGETRLSTSSSRRLAFPDRSGHVNHGAQLDDNDNGGVRGEGVASGSAESSSVTPSVVIKVDSSYLHNEAPSTQTSPDVESSSSSSASSSSSSQASRQCNGGVEGGDDIAPTVTVSVDSNDNRDKEEEGGRVSRSTVSSSEPVEESPEDAKKRPDSQVTTLIS